MVRSERAVGRGFVLQAILGLVWGVLIPGLVLYRNRAGNRLEMPIFSSECLIILIMSMVY